MKSLQEPPAHWIAVPLMQTKRQMEDYYEKFRNYQEFSERIVYFSRR